MRSGVSGLALKRIDGCVTSGDRRVAWFKLEAQRWSFRSEAERVSLIMSGASRYAQLVGRRLHMRVTTRPYPVEHWGRSLDENTPNPLPGWKAHLRSEQIHVFGLTLAEKQVYLGIELLQPTYRRHAVETELRELEAIISSSGFQGRAVTPAELEYLIHRSVSLGAPAPLTASTSLPTWESEDLAQFTDHVSWSCKPLDRSVRVVAEVDGQQFIRHVVTLTLGRMVTLDIPEMQPWLQRSDQLFPVEWSVTADVVPPTTVRHGVSDALARIRSQVAHYAEHDLDAPTGLARQRARALEIEDEVSGGNPLATRVHCWVRAAVSGATELEALDKARQLTELYAPALTLTRGADQYRTAREFIPGEPLANVAHRRHMPVTTFAAGVPAVTALIGDRRGFHIGKTSGSSELAVCWAPWDAMEIRERSGVTIVGGTLGAGKSGLTGVIGYWSGLSRIHSIILDPGGMLGRLTELPELAEYSRTVNLMNAVPGTLGPYRVIAEPRRAQFETVKEWENAVELANAQRRTLAVDTLIGLLPTNVTDQPETRKVIQLASRAVGGSHDRDLRQIISHLWDANNELAELSGHARYIAGELDDVSRLPQTQLLFGGDLGTAVGDDDYVLQVLTLRGNVTPKEGKDRKSWSIQERIGSQLLRLAGFYTGQFVYSRDRHERKFVALDEVAALTMDDSGQSLIQSLAHDSRKWNTRLLLAAPSVSDILVARIEDRIDNAFIGRTEGPKAQEAALSLLGVEQGIGYEAVLAGLSSRERTSGSRLGYREFIWNDGDGGIERVSIHWPDAVRKVLDTTANPLGRHDTELVNV